MTRFTFTGDPIPDDIAALMDELDAAHNALAIALHRADRDIEGAHADVVRARAWLAEVGDRLEATRPAT